MAKQTLPKSLPVLGEKVEIKYKENVYVSGDRTDGSYAPSSLTIEIDTTNDEDKQEATLLHEILHAILDISGHADVIDDLKKEEGIVRVLERVIHKLYKRR